MKEINLYHGSIATVDDTDYDLVSRYRWREFRRRPGEPVYAVASVRNGLKTNRIYMHRLLLGAVRGQMVDHVDRNALNNCRANLRFCTVAQNASNRRKVSGASKYKGVGINKSHRSPWIARIKVNGIEHHLGSYSNECDAALAYNAAAIKYFGEYARPNEVENG